MCVSPRLRGRTDAHFNVLVNALHYYALPALPPCPTVALPSPVCNLSPNPPVRSRHAVTPEYDELLITPKENLDQEEEEMEEEQVLVRSQSLMEFRSSSKFIEAVKTAKRLFWAKTINPMVVVRPPNFRASRVRFSNIK